MLGINLQGVKQGFDLLHWLMIDYGGGQIPVGIPPFAGGLRQGFCPAPVAIQGSLGRKEQIQAVVDTILKVNSER